MWGVNKGVWAWNRTTGGTKAELANTLLITSGFCQAAGIGINEGDPVGSSITMLMAGGILTVLYRGFYSQNKTVEMLEERALRRGAMDPKAEEVKRKYGFVGLGQVVASLAFGIPQALEGKIGMDIAWGSTVLLTAPSFYVMRADYLPPRKSLMAMGIDKAKELLRGWGGSTAPAPAFGRAALRT